MKIGTRVSKNMVIVGYITTLDELIEKCRLNEAIYCDFGIKGYIKPARVIACQQFYNVAVNIRAKRYYSILDYKHLQCDPPPKTVRVKKTSSANTRSGSNQPEQKLLPYRVAPSSAPSSTP